LHASTTSEDGVLCTITRSLWPRQWPSNFHGLLHIKGKFCPAYITVIQFNAGSSNLVCKYKLGWWCVPYYY